MRLAEERTLDEYPLESRSSDRSDRVLSTPDLATITPARLDLRLRPDVAPQAVWLGADADGKLVAGASRNPVSLEQYRRLAATLHEAQVEKGLRAVVVTSSVPREGKTLTAVNLALTLSESYGRRVLLIDADLRRPSVHELLGLQNERGLADVLHSDRAEIPTVQVSPLLTVLPAGPPDQNPLAGLSSERMRILLEESTGRYDWVILDTPPLALLSDAQLLSRLTQAAVFVIRAGVTPFAVVDRAITELGREFIIGTVLNGVDQNAVPATGYYGDYYDQGR
ncbi:MAG TPA: CpsD/CapB family tyrosine-protein kinase [Vicinamibacterales bacterium]|nr:CpsD/CapB family tyrosine-protein kinase [Vicinamibacterales bacterium]